MLPAVFDFLNGPVRDLVTQIYEAVGYLGVALWVAIESVDHPDPLGAVLPFAGFLVGEGEALEPHHRTALELLADRPRRHARATRWARSSPTPSARGAAGRSSSAGVATSAITAADLDKADALLRASTARRPASSAG